MPLLVSTRWPTLFLQKQALASLKVLDHLAKMPSPFTCRAV